MFVTCGIFLTLLYGEETYYFFGILKLYKETTTSCATVHLCMVLVRMYLSCIKYCMLRSLISSGFLSSA